MCGTPASAGGVVLLNGTFLCSRHASQPLCLWCGAPAVGSVSAHPACVGCRRSVVHTDEVAQAHSREIAALLAQLGFSGIEASISFRQDSDAWIAGFSSAQQPDILGITTYPEPPSTVTTVEVALGLPSVEFVGTLAHELVHASLANSTGARGLPLRIQEGLCEVAAEMCVSNSFDSYQVRRFRARIRQRTDPIYGAGYAIVGDRVSAIGLKSTIDMICNGDW